MALQYLFADEAVPTDPKEEPYVGGDPEDEDDVIEDDDDEDDD